MTPRGKTILTQYVSDEELSPERLAFRKWFKAAVARREKIITVGRSVLQGAHNSGEGRRRFDVDDMLAIELRYREVSNEHPEWNQRAIQGEVGRSFDCDDRKVRDVLRSLKRWREILKK